MDKAISNHEIISILKWYKLSGVDEVLCDKPTDWSTWRDAEPIKVSAPQTRERAPMQSRAAPRTNTTARPSLTTPPDEAVLEARTAAREAKSLDQLHKILKSFEGCGLSRTATNLCFYRGAPDADIMLIGEAPGRDEDIQGKPFVGQAGQLLDKMLAAIELDESAVHITNIIYWRPPGNRTPTPQEAQICQPFIERQLELVSPKLVLFLGGSAAKQMLNTTEGIMRLRGKWRDFKYGEQTVKSMATLHPAYLLRTPAAKRLAWRDLLEIRSEINKFN